MGTYRIEESPNKRAGCSVKHCKDNKVKIEKGELRLGTWVETDRFQSWSYRHWGCVTQRVLENILMSISEDGSPDFDMLDGLEELSAENQAKVKKAILDGEIDDADKTEQPDIENNDAHEGAQEEANGSSKKAKSRGKAKTTKRSRAESDDEENAPVKKSKKVNGKSTVKEETPEKKPSKRGRPRKEEVEVKSTKPAAKSSKKSKKKAEAGDELDAEQLDDGNYMKSDAPPKVSRSKVSTANGEKSKRGRKKKVADAEI